MIPATPAGSEFASLLLKLMTFGAGFMMRLVGATGDKAFPAHGVPLRRRCR